jgi:hypothetical protein
MFVASPFMFLGLLGMVSLVVASLPKMLSSTPSVLHDLLTMVSLVINSLPEMLLGRSSMLLGFVLPLPIVLLNCSFFTSPCSLYFISQSYANKSAETYYCAPSLAYHV